VGDLEERLAAGEKMIWTGRPAQGVLFTGHDIFAIPFSLLWCGFAIFWEMLALKTSRTLTLFSLWGIPFVLVGIYGVVGRFIIDGWMRRRIWYGVTDQRILILRAPPFSKFTSINTDRLPELSLNEKADGRGTIYFGPQGPFYGRGYGFGATTPSLSNVPQFIAIQNARSVFEDIQILSRRSS
jgi:hypothetical protein